MERVTSFTHPEHNISVIIISEPDRTTLEFTCLYSSLTSKKGEIAMLFHVIMTHTEDNCPAYHTEWMPEVIASLEKLESLGKELKVKAHSILWGAPAHVAFAILEADSLTSIGRFLNSMAIKQDFEITPVENLADVIKFGKAAIAARAKK